jgi:hypothetical protein
MAIKRITKTNLKHFFKTCKKGQLITLAKTIKPEEVEEEAGHYRFQLMWESHNREGGVYRIY